MVQVHAGFAANSSVHLREERGGHIGVTDAAFVDGCRKARQVRGDAAAYGHKEGAAGGIGLHELPFKGQHGVHGLALLRGLQAHVGLRRRKVPQEAFQHPRDVLVKHHNELRLRLQAGQSVG